MADALRKSSSLSELDQYYAEEDISDQRLASSPTPADTKDDTGLETGRLQRKPGQPKQPKNSVASPQVTEPVIRSRKRKSPAVPERSTRRKISAQSVSRDQQESSSTRRKGPRKSGAAANTFSELLDEKPEDARNGDVVDLTDDELLKLPESHKKPPHKAERKKREKVGEAADVEEEALLKQAPYLSQSDAGRETTARKTPKAKRTLTAWQPNYLLQNPKSKLAKINLRRLLADERAWSLLSREEQIEVIRQCPMADRVDLDDENCVRNFAKSELLSNNAFSTDIRLFQEDLAEGRLDPAWQEEAVEAMEERARGMFDAWKLKEYEEFWGQKQKTSGLALAAESGAISMEELIGAQLFRLGDVWLFDHNFTRDGNGGTIHVAKEAKLIEITEKSELFFHLPPKQHKLSSLANGADIRVGPFTSPNGVVQAMLKEDGRVEQRIANAWKQIRVKRKNQDIGSPFEIRELYWVRKGRKSR